MYAFSSMQIRWSLGFEINTFFYINELVTKTQYDIRMQCLFHTPIKCSNYKSLREKERRVSVYNYYGYNGITF